MSRPPPAGTAKAPASNSTSKFLAVDTTRGLSIDAGNAGSPVGAGPRRSASLVACDVCGAHDEHLWGPEDLPGYACCIACLKRIGWWDEMDDVALLTGIGRAHLLTKQDGVR